MIIQNKIVDHTGSCKRTISKSHKRKFAKEHNMSRKMYLNLRTYIYSHTYLTYPHTSALGDIADTVREVDK